MVKAFAVAIGCIIFTPASAQDNHAIGHDEYLGWSSGKVQDCCRGIKSGGDCGTLAAEQYRQTATGTEIMIDTTWCPVKPEHFVLRGTSPNGGLIHACISRQISIDPCDRLRCYMGKAGW